MEIAGELVDTSLNRNPMFTDSAFTLYPVKQSIPLLCINE
jgi:hypothetical protein